MNPELNNMIDQLQLSQEDKEKIVTKSLNANNPQAPHNLTKYSYKDKSFKTDDIVEQLVVHFSMDGCIIKEGSDELVDQEEYWNKKKDKDNRLLL